MKNKKREYTVLFSNMSKEDFHETLETLGMSKSKLSKEMGISYSTVKSWHVKNKKMPLYVEKHLNALLEIQNFKDIQNNIKLLQNSISKL